MLQNLLEAMVGVFSNIFFDIGPLFFLVEYLNY